MGRGKSWVGQAQDSVLQALQLTELKQTKEWDRYPKKPRNGKGTQRNQGMVKAPKKPRNGKETERNQEKVKVPRPSLAPQIDTSTKQLGETLSTMTSGRQNGFGDHAFLLKGLTVCADGPVTKTNQGWAYNTQGATTIHKAG